MLYEGVVCELKMGMVYLKIFFSNMGVKQGCPLSPTLFGLCIDELEEMILEYAQGNVIDGLQIGLFVVLLLLYSDNVVLLAHTLERIDKFWSSYMLFVEKVEWQRM